MTLNDVRAEVLAAAAAVQRATMRLSVAPMGSTGSTARDWRLLAEDHLKDARRSLEVTMAMLTREERS